MGGYNGPINDDIPSWANPDGDLPDSPAKTPTIGPGITKPPPVSGPSLLPVVPADPEAAKYGLSGRNYAYESWQPYASADAASIAKQKAYQQFGRNSFVTNRNLPSWMNTDDYGYGSRDVLEASNNNKNWLTKGYHTELGKVWDTLTPEQKSRDLAWEFSHPGQIDPRYKGADKTPIFTKDPLSYIPDNARAYAENKGFRFAGSSPVNVQPPPNQPAPSPAPMQPKQAQTAGGIQAPQYGHQGSMLGSGKGGIQQPQYDQKQPHYSQQPQYGSQISFGDFPSYAGGDDYGSGMSSGKGGSQVPQTKVPTVATDANPQTQPADSPFGSNSLI